MKTTNNNLRAATVRVGLTAAHSPQLSARKIMWSMWLASHHQTGWNTTGLFSNTFKKRWNKHEGDFRNTRDKHNTRLSTHIWQLKAENKPYQTKWEILDRAPPHNPTSGKCRLCLKEIYYIIFRPDSASLNKKHELFNTCRHRKQKLLVNAWKYPNIFFLVLHFHQK